MNMERLEKQLKFIIEIDKVKNIFRQTYLSDGQRKENDAEHSWHLAVMAFLLTEHAGGGRLDIFKVMKMVLIHDLVEIYAGDTYCYDEKGYEDKCEREQAAAAKLFGILPQDQEAEFRSLWEEFEEVSTEEAKYAAMLDRLQPLLLNYTTGGKSWKEHGINSSKVKERYRMILEEENIFSEYVRGLLQDAVKKGYLAE